MLCTQETHISADSDLGDSPGEEEPHPQNEGSSDEIGRIQGGVAIDMKGYLDPPRPGHSPAAGQGFLPTPPQPHSPKGSSKRVSRRMRWKVGSLVPQISLSAMMTCESRVSHSPGPSCGWWGDRGWGPT